MGVAKICIVQVCLTCPLDRLVGVEAIAAAAAAEIEADMGSGAEFVVVVVVDRVTAMGCWEAWN